MIQINSLYKDYARNKKSKVRALDGVTLTLPNKGLIFITGKSGSGKSTLLNLLGGLDSPTDGEIIIDGISIKEFKEKERCAFLNEYVGFVFQEYDLLPQYSVGHNVALALELHGKSVERELVEDALRRLELTDGEKTLFDRKVSELSGGQKQRVAIARALVKDPKLILADEPTGALDSETGKSLYELLKKLSEEKLVVVITHDEECAQTYGDRIIRLKDGKVEEDSGADRQTCGESADFDVRHSNGESESSVREKKQKRKSGRLPFKRIFAMGLSGLKLKRVKLAVSIVLAVIAFTMFGFAVTTATIDYLDVELNTAYKNGVKNVVIHDIERSISKRVYVGTQFDGTFYSHDEYMRPYMTTKQREIFAEREKAINVYDAELVSVSDYEYHSVNRDNASLSEKLNRYIHFRSIYNIVTLDPETGESDVSLTPVTPDSRLPRDSEEIAISDYTADMFMKLGYKDVDGDGTKYMIKSPDELIGRTICGYKIVGVYKTDEDTEWFKKEFDRDYSSLYRENYSGGLPHDGLYHSYYDGGFHMMNCAFMHKDVMEDDSYLMIYRLSGSKSKDKDLIKALSYKEYFEWTYDDGSGHYLTNYHTARFETRYSGFIYENTFLSIITRKEFVIVAIVVSIIFAIVSALILMSFLSFGFEAREKEIGILRALGARKKDVAMICLTEAIIIAAADFVLSLIATGVICAIINAKVYISLFFMGIIPILSVFGLSFITAFLASVLPTVRSTRKKPVDILRGAA